MTLQLHQKAEEGLRKRSAAPSQGVPEPLTSNGLQQGTGAALSLDELRAQHKQALAELWYFRGLRRALTLLNEARSVLDDATYTYLSNKLYDEIFGNIPQPDDESAIAERLNEEANGL